MGERILLIEDDEGLLQLTRLQLEQAGYQVQATSHGAAGIRLAKEWKPDLILLDVLMPDMNGWAVYQKLREFTNIPICFTTALGEEQHLLHGLDLGADDYIIKPYSHKELLARVRASLHRSRRSVGDSPLKIGPVRIDFFAHQVWVHDQPVHLTPTEMRLLQILARQAGRVVPHEELLREIWGVSNPKKRDSLKLYIWYLRRKLEEDPTHPRLILSERGVGYRLLAAGNEESL